MNESIKMIYRSDIDEDGSLLDDVAKALNIPVGGCIIAVADIGRWDGRHHGYKIVGHNLRGIIGPHEDGVLRIWVDEKNICASLAHHDGTHYFTFRKIKARVNVLEVSGMVLKGKDVSSLTTSLKRYVPKNLGW